ncbi:MAG: sulfatase [Candidatus Sumerlaeota bacterium]|nr:sulfatase [Candidatus Sumerlaeota bacterium]
MNLIWICSDTFRNDHLGCMGNKRVKTPGLDRLAAAGVLFENAHAEGLPTGPERLVHFTGKFTLPFRGWSPLTADEITLPEHLRKLGWRTALMADTYHMFKANYNFHRGFHEWRWIRGQEGDAYVSANKGEDPWKYFSQRSKEIPPERKHLGSKDFTRPLKQYLQNVADRGDDESKYFPAQTIGEAMRWLEDNRDAEKFLLWIELFDPHEPFDPPKRFYDMYADPNYKGTHYLSPWHHSLSAADFTKEELDDVRALYAGEVSMVDYWVGKLAAKVDALGLRDQTIILFTSDHGTLLGEHGGVTKTPSLQNTLSQWIANVPLIISNPRGPRGMRVKGMVWSPDFMPTCCEMLGVEPPETAHGRGFWKTTQGDSSAGREYTITGWGKKYQYVVDLEWRFMANNGVVPDQLYNRAEDPLEQRDVAARHPDVCARMRKRLEKFWEDAKALRP